MVARRVRLRCTPVGENALFSALCSGWPRQPRRSRRGTDLSMGQYSSCFDRPRAQQWPPVHAIWTDKHQREYPAPKREPHQNAETASIVVCPPFPYDRYARMFAIIYRPGVSSTMGRPGRLGSAALNLVISSPKHPRRPLQSFGAGRLTRTMHPGHSPSGVMNPPQYTLLTLPRSGTEYWSGR